jgi:hypothetical protein
MLDTLRSLPTAAPDQALFAKREPSETGARVRKYFETSGFSRWTAIYGAGDIPPIWKVIRDGHARTRHGDVVAFEFEGSHGPRRGLRNG